MTDSIPSSSLGPSNRGHELCATVWFQPPSSAVHTPPVECISGYNIILFPNLSHLLATQCLSFNMRSLNHGHLCYWLCNFSPDYLHSFQNASSLSPNMDPSEISKSLLLRLSFLDSITIRLRIWQLTEDARHLGALFNSKILTFVDVVLLYFVFVLLRMESMTSHGLDKYSTPELQPSPGDRCVYVWVLSAQNSHWHECSLNPYNKWNN